MSLLGCTCIVYNHLILEKGSNSAEVGNFPATHGVMKREAGRRRMTKVKRKRKSTKKTRKAKKDSKRLKGKRRRKEKNMRNKKKKQRKRKIKNRKNRKLRRRQQKRNKCPKQSDDTNCAATINKFTSKLKKSKTIFNIYNRIKRTSILIELKKSKVKILRNSFF